MGLATTTRLLNWALAGLDGVNTLAEGPSSADLHHLSGSSSSSSSSSSSTASGKLVHTRVFEADLSVDGSLRLVVVSLTACSLQATLQHFHMHCCSTTACILLNMLSILCNVSCHVTSNRGFAEFFLAFCSVSGMRLHPWMPKWYLTAYHPDLTHQQMI